MLLLAKFGFFRQIEGTGVAYQESAAVDVPAGHTLLLADDGTGYKVTFSSDTYTPRVHTFGVLFVQKSTF